MQMGGQLPLPCEGSAPTPTRWWCAPRIWGTLFAMVALALCTDLFAVLGGITRSPGWCSAFPSMTPSLRSRSGQWGVQVRDIGESLAKTAAFSLAIGLLSSRAGLTTRGGARAVGQQVAGSVVQGIVAVLLLDMILTMLIGGELHS